MKKIVILTLLISIGMFYTSCNSPLKPEGAIQDKELTFEAFDEVELSGSFRVIFVEDSTYHVRIESFPNIIENLELTQNGFGLKIKEKKGVSSDTEIYNIYIHTKKVKEVVLNDAVVVDEPSFLSNDDLLIELNDATKLIADVQAKELKIELNDSSDANLKGSALNLELQGNDSSNLKSPFLTVDNADVELNDVAFAEINVKSELEGVIQDNSTLKYLGSPTKDVKQKDLAKMEQQ